jgi:hypothetical protein
MKGYNGVPVHQSEQTPGLEESRLPQRATLRAIRSNSKIEQRMAGQTHLRAQ